MTNHLDWPSLAARQNFLKLILFYKIDNKLVEMDLNLIPLDTVTQKYPYHYTIPSIRTEAYAANSFLLSTTKLWNELPESLVMTDNRNDFNFKF